MISRNFKNRILWKVIVLSTVKLSKEARDWVEVLLILWFWTRYSLRFKYDSSLTTHTIEGKNYYPRHVLT